jgi:hypothetical protein
VEVGIGFRMLRVSSTFACVVMNRVDLAVAIVIGGVLLNALLVVLVAVTILDIAR